jgi:GNAT superfamily N-acetyltransferase
MPPRLAPEGARNLANVTVGPRLECLAPDELDPAVAPDLAGVHNAALEDVPVARSTAQMFHQDLTRGDEPASALWIARDGDVVVGFATLTEPVHEYTDAAFLRGAVLPSHQRRGVGGALLAAVTERTGRPVLRVRAWRGTAGAKAVPAWGFRRTMTHAVRRLVPGDPVPEEDALRAEVAGAAAAYVLTRRRGPTPAAELAEMVLLREAINDAPDAHEFEAYPVDRIAAYEASLVERRQTQYTVVARHRGTGEPAGITMVCVPEAAPAIAAQEDTSVLPAHRGRRLGLLLKLDMLDWIRADRPDVLAIDTWNDATNDPMIAVNQRLGARIVAENSAYRRPR